MKSGWIKRLILALAAVLLLAQTSLARTLFYPVAITGYHRRPTRRSASSSSIRQVGRRIKNQNQQQQSLSEPPVTENTSTATAANDAQLGPVGRAVAGIVEIAVSTCLEYVSGFVGGYALGTVTDIPRLLFRPMKQQTLVQETSSRFVRLHGKSLQWAKQWGGISAAFGGFNVLIKVVRAGKEDDWNSIISSTAAGVFFARKGEYVLVWSVACRIDAS